MLPHSTGPPQATIRVAAIARRLSSVVRGGACYAIRIMGARTVAAALIVIVGAGAERVLASELVGDDTRPLVAVIGENEGTEVTDFVVPYGVLSASGAARVVDVSVHDGPVQMMPALKLMAKETIASFDAKHPAGANYVIVPAVHRSTDPTMLAWLQRQADRGATIVGVCDGVQVVAAAGLLENRAATGHWYSMSTLERTYPHTQWIRDRRYVQDGPVITTTGVTASLPVSLALVAQMAGAERATALTRELGARGWDARHESNRFRLTARHLLTAVWNVLAFWRWERVGIPIAAGVDEISLSFTADAIGRTYRATAVTVGNGVTQIRTKRGLTILPEATDAAGVDRLEEIPSGVPPAQALDRVLTTIVHHDGAPTARFVALQLEYPWDGALDHEP